MSVDKPADGDGAPDRFSGREDRPFPGAPENREPAPELPKNTLSMEEVRAIHQKSSSNAEFEAAAKAHAEAQATDPDSPAQGSPAPGAAGQGPAEALGDGAAPEAHLGVQKADAAGTAAPGTGVPRDWQPEGLARPEGVTGQDPDLPPFPGAPEAREAVPAAPGSTPSMEDIRAMHQKASSNPEFEAMAGEYAAAQEDAVTPGSGRGQVIDGPDGFFGRAGDLQDQEAVEPGEPEGDERTGPGTRANTDTPQQTERGEETGGEKAVGEGQSEDNQEQKPKDLAPIEHPAPDAETNRPTEASAEAAADQQPDDPRMSAMERQMERMMATVEALQEKLEASEAKLEEDKAAFEQELGDLQAKNAELEQKVAEMESGRREGASASDRSPDSPDDLEPSETDGVTEAVTRPDVLGAGDEADGTADSADVIERANHESDIAEGKTEPAPDRPELSQAGAAGLGLAGQLGMVHPALQLAVGGDAARRAFEKMSPDEQYDAINTMNSVVNAYGGMSPGMAFLAAVTSAYGPGVYSRAKEAAQGFLHKVRRED